MLKLRYGKRYKMVALAAAFGRLCVETKVGVFDYLASEAAAFGRLCVETVALNPEGGVKACSRLRAAVC